MEKTTATDLKFADLIAEMKEAADAVQKDNLVYCDILQDLQWILDEQERASDGFSLYWVVSKYSTYLVHNEMQAAKQAALMEIHNDSPRSFRIFYYEGVYSFTEL